MNSALSEHRSVQLLATATQQITPPRARHYKNAASIALDFAERPCKSDQTGEKKLRALGFAQNPMPLKINSSPKAMFMEAIY
jgi:hypothetical protein